MAKIIRSHTECGYRKMGTCLHEENSVVDCYPLGEQNFPTGCPLEDNKPTLVLSPRQCVYNKEICGKHFCEHPAHVIRYCTWTNTFPTGCPLQSIIKSIPIKVFKARIRYNRSRSKCFYHSRFGDVCMLERNGNCGKCIGVRCGDYKVKRT